MFIPPAFFVSNSIPKSGSSLIYNYQRNLFCNVYSTDMVDSYIRLSELLDIDCLNGFVPPSSIPALEKLLMNAHSFNLISPCVIKTHAPFSLRFSRFLRSSSNVFSSLCIRDPHQVLKSAIINHRRRPHEFKYFVNPILGSLRITFYYYLSIYKSFARSTSVECCDNIIHFNRLRDSPSSALYRSMNSFFAQLSSACPSSFSPNYINSIVDSVVGSSYVNQKVEYRITSLEDKASYSLTPIESVLSSFILSAPVAAFGSYLDA